jgi:hypothetical protein
MGRNWIAGVGLAVALLIPAGVAAHGGHLHKVMGTVVGVQGSQVDVKGTDGKAVRVTLDAKTVITRGKAKLDLSALKAGERVSIDYMQEKSGNLAKTVKLGTAPPSK